MNNTANYDGSGSFATDDLVFNSTSVVNAAATAGIVCNSITIASTYSGTWSLSGQTATCAQGFSDDGITGAHNYGNRITCNGASALFHVGSSVGTITATSCVVALNGATAMVFDDDKGITIAGFSFGASALVSSTGGANTTVTGSAPITFVNGGTLTINASRILTNLTASGSSITITAGSPTIVNNGAGNCNFSIAGNNITNTIPAMTLSGSAGYLFAVNAGNTGAIFELGGTFSTSTAAITIQQTRADPSDMTFNTNNYSLTCGSFTIGVSDVSGKLTVNFGSSVISISSIVASDLTYTTGFSRLNFQTSQWTCTGAWTFGSNHTVDPGTSLVNLTGSAAQTITPNGKLFYDVTINRVTAGTCTFSGAVNLHTLIISSTNTQAVSWTGTSMTSSGNLTLDGSGTLNIGNAIIATGASGIVHFDSTLSTITASACALTMNGTTGMSLNDNKGVTFSSLVLGASAVVTSAGSATSTFATTTNPLTMGNSSSLTLNAITIFTASTNGGSFHSIGTGCTIAGNASIYWRVPAGGGTINFPAYSYTGSAVEYIDALGGTAEITLTGNINSGSNGRFTIYNTGASTFTFNSGNYSITNGGTYFNFGNNFSSSTATFNFGSSVVSIVSMGKYETGTTNVNLQTSQWTVSGLWSFGSNHTITGTAATQSVTFTNTSTITSNGKVFPGSVVLNASGKTITLADAFSVATNLTITAGTLAGSFTTTCAGDVTVTVSTTFNRLIITKTTTRTITIGAGQTLTLTNLTDTNLNGSVGAQTQWRSSSPGTTVYLTLPAPIILTYQNPQDVTASQMITSTDAGSTDGNRNINWEFSGTSTATVRIQLYNYNTSTYDTFDSIGLSIDYELREFFIPLDTNYISGGNSKVRFCRIENGTILNHLYIDYVALIS
jgi:hypothetical protein